MATSRFTVRQRLGRLLDGVDAIVGTPKAGAPLTVNTFGVDALGVYEDDYFNDWYGRFYDGPLKNTDFTVTDFDKVDDNALLGTLTISPDRTVAVTVLDLFELYQEFSPSEMNDAINAALDLVGHEALIPVVDETLQVVTSVWEYTVPNGVSYIDRIYQESNTSGRYSANDNLIDYRHWRILPGRVLWFDFSHASLTAGRRLRIVGQKAPAELLLDADETEVGVSYLTWQAKAILHMSRIRGRGSDFDEHESQMRLAQGIADRERGHVKVAALGRKVE